MEERKVKVIVKKCGEQYGSMQEISGELKNLQRIVGGYIEAINCGKFYILCNEDGKTLSLDYNMPLNNDILLGNIIVIGSSGEEFADIEISFDEWKEYVAVQKKKFAQLGR